MGKVRTHSFNGIKYEIEFTGKIDGLSETKEGLRYMVIATEPYTQNELITIIHEGFHASRWNAHEETVDQVSSDIGRLLWRLGYRRPRKNVG